MDKNWQEREWTFRAKDGVSLHGTLFEPLSPKAQLLVASATATPQGVYRRFARVGAELGFRVLTLDYRGTGRSRAEPLKGYRATFVDWAKLDLAAALEQLDPHLPVVMAGHSFGGQALGMMPNAERVQAYATFGVGTGWLGFMPRHERPRVWALWNAIGPLLLKMKGYFPSSVIGLGEDLPAGVFLQWSRWCQFKHHLFDDAAFQFLKPGFDAIRCPILGVNTLDDLWAPPISRDHFLKGYRSAHIQPRDMSPVEFGVNHCGHMGYFKPEFEALWREVFAWFEAQLQVEAGVDGAASN